MALKWLNLYSPWNARLSSADTGSGSRSSSSCRNRRPSKYIHSRATQMQDQGSRQQNRFRAWYESWAAVATAPGAVSSPLSNSAACQTVQGETQLQDGGPHRVRRVAPRQQQPLEAQRQQRLGAVPVVRQRPVQQASQMSTSQRSRSLPRAAGVWCSEVHTVISGVDSPHVVLCWQRLTHWDGERQRVAGFPSHPLGQRPHLATINDPACILVMGVIAKISEEL